MCPLLKLALAGQEIGSVSWCPPPSPREALAALPACRWCYWGWRSATGGSTSSPPSTISHWCPHKAKRHQLPMIYTFMCPHFHVFTNLIHCIQKILKLVTTMLCVFYASVFQKHLALMFVWWFVEEKNYLTPVQMVCWTPNSPSLFLVFKARP